METTPVEQTLDYNVFEGPIEREMPRLIKAGLVPASAAEIMRLRLDHDWQYGNYYCEDAVVYHHDGGVRLVHDSEDLRRLNMESQKNAGGLVLPDGAWWSLDGPLFSEREIAAYTNEKQTIAEVKSNPFWRWLARDDQSLLDEYADYMFSRVKARSGDHEQHAFIMNMHLSSFLSSHIVLRPWSLYSLRGGHGSAYGNTFVYEMLRLIGVPQHGNI